MEKIKILIVDDHKMFLEGISSILNDIEFIDVIATAKNGKQTLKLLKSLTPDIIITDIDMPGVDGIELTKIIKTQTSSINYSC